MANDSSDATLDDAIDINPRRVLSKGAESVYISMQQLEPGERQVATLDRRLFNGSGSRFQNGDTLLARITPCLENGKTAYVDFLGDGEVAHGSTEFIVLSGSEDVTDNLFVYYLARSPVFRDFAIVRMEGSSGRQRVPAPTLKRFAFACPSLPKQRAIAHILGSLDDKIELNRRMNRALEAMARALFKAWFIDFEPVKARADGATNFPGMSQDLVALFPDAFTDSELGEIPAGWEVKSLDDIADFLNGLACQKYPPENGEDSLPVIKIRELRQGITEITDRATVNVPDKYIVEDGDVLFSWSGSLVVRIWCNGNGVLNQHVFKVSSETYPKWFYYMWTLRHLEEFQRIAADKATTMGHIKRRHLTDAKILVPSQKLLAAMDEHLAPLIKAQVTNQIECRALAETRDALLPKLISGEIRVSGNEEADDAG